MAQFRPADCWRGPRPSLGPARSRRRRSPLRSTGWSRPPASVRCAEASSGGHPYLPPPAHRLGMSHADRPHNVQILLAKSLCLWVDRGLPPPDHPPAPTASGGEISVRGRHQPGQSVPARPTSGFDKPIARSRRAPAAPGLFKTVIRTAHERTEPAARSGSASPIY